MIARKAALAPARNNWFINPTLCADE